MIKGADKLLVVTGAGGFIGGSLVAEFRKQGYRNIRAVDIKPFEEWYQVFDDVENLELDLNLKENCERSTARAPTRFTISPPIWAAWAYREQQGPVHALRPDQHPHAAGGARTSGSRVFLLFVGLRLQRRQAARPESPGLKEEDAYPALAEDGYGWEKLFSERMCRHFREDFGCRRAWRASTTSTAPWHLGRRTRESAGGDLPQGDRGQAERQARDRDLGRRHQTRSFMYIDDCVKGIDSS